MRKIKGKGLWAFAIPPMIMLGMTFSPLLTMMTGEDIKLETKPIDPTDLFRGDYVILHYKAEEVNESKVDNEIKEYFKDYNRDSGNLEVYSILKKNENDTYDVEKVVMDKPKEGLFIKGEIDYWYIQSDEEIRSYTNTEEEFQQEKANQTVDIDYALDNYFVPENSGGELEDASEEGTVIATVKVRNGHSVLTDLEIK